MVVGIVGIGGGGVVYFCFVFFLYCGCEVLKFIVFDLMFLGIMKLGRFGFVIFFGFCGGWDGCDGCGG